ncbi:MAG TPA: ATP-binding cassette domain-containing protein, partial [Polyangiaceae bacterium]|nr:ATP-binding cassette domain-containing protein [Polyangiaceae bacterium]
NPGQTAHEVALSGLSEWLEARHRYDRVCAQLAEPGDRLEALLSEQAEATEALEKLGGFARASEADRILAALGIENPGQDVATMSGGERRRVALARLLLAQPDLAILDEPTNHLDARSIEWLEEYLLERFPGALLLVTHDRFLLNALAQRTLEVTGGRVYSYEGGWEAFLLARAEREAMDERTEQNRQNFLRKELEWLRRQPKARGGKQKARISRAEAAIASGPNKKAGPLALQLGEERLGGTVLEARELSVRIGERTLIEKLDFRLGRGQRIGILGKSGSGKTTLLRTLLGEIAPGSGEIVTGKNTRVAYLDQMRGGLDPEESVYDAVTGGQPRVSVGQMTFTSYSYLERFRFRGDAVRQKVGMLSGGERARVALARLLLSPANVLVLDEPTNDLDVMTLAALEDLLLELEGAALLVSHDRYFLDRVATSVLALDDGRIEEIQGGYTAWAERRDWLEAERREREDEQKRASAPPPPAAAAAGAATAAPAKKKLSWNEQREYEGLLERVEAAQAEAARLEAELADPELYVSRRQEAEGLQSQLMAARKLATELEERWFELEEKRG